MHTKGPYTACFTSFDGQVTGFHIVSPPWGSTHPIASYSLPSAKLHDVKPERSSAEIEATGRLFAGADDLFKALRDIAEGNVPPGFLGGIELETQLSFRTRMLEWCQQTAKAAIAKVEGRT